MRRKYILLISGLVLATGLTFSQTIADAARQNKAGKKAKRVYTSEDMAPAKEAAPKPATVADNGASPSAKKGKKNADLEAQRAAEAADAGKAEALAEDKAKLDQMFTELDEAEAALEGLRTRAVEVETNPDATADDKTSARAAAEAAASRRTELQTAALAQRAKVQAATPPAATPPVPQTEAPQ